jgi:hypothetical protein
MIVPQRVGRYTKAKSRAVTSAAADIGFSRQQQCFAIHRH